MPHRSLPLMQTGELPPSQIALGQTLVPSGEDNTFWLQEDTELVEGGVQQPPIYVIEDFLLIFSETFI